MNFKFPDNKLCIATTNKGKFNEIAAMLSNFDLKIYNLLDLNINSHPVENGTTFEENALIKAKYYFKLTNMPILADDSGFCIPAIDDQPGIFSARFAGSSQNYPQAFEKIKLLLKQKGIANFLEQRK